MRSEIFRQIEHDGPWAEFAVRLLSPLIWYFTKSVQQGAQTPLYLALADFEELIPAQYYWDSRPRAPS